MYRACSIAPIVEDMVLGDKEYEKTLMVKKALFGEELRIKNRNHMWMLWHIKNVMPLDMVAELTLYTSRPPLPFIDELQAKWSPSVLSYMVKYIMLAENEEAVLVDTEKRRIDTWGIQRHRVTTDPNSFNGGWSRMQWVYDEWKQYYYDAEDANDLARVDELEKHHRLLFDGQDVGTVVYNWRYVHLRTTVLRRQEITNMYYANYNGVDYWGREEEAEEEEKIVFQPLSIQVNKGNPYMAFDKLTRTEVVVNDEEEEDVRYNRDDANPAPQKIQKVL
jgi:hypothetical protein